MCAQPLRQGSVYLDGSRGRLGGTRYVEVPHVPRLGDLTYKYGAARRLDASQAYFFQVVARRGVLHL